MYALDVVRVESQKFVDFRGLGKILRDFAGQHNCGPAMDVLLRDMDKQTQNPELN